MIRDKEEILKKIIRKFGNIKNNSVLDIGFGNGEYTKFISNYAQFAVGIEDNENFVKKARKDYKATNLKYEVCLAQSLNFKDKTFDSIFYIKSLHHVPIDQQYKALQEAHRILKSNGTILIIEPIYKGGSYEKIVSIYNNEKIAREEVIKAIENSSELFNLEKEQSFQVTYICKDFEDLFLSEIKPKPWINWRDSFKPKIEELLKKCKRDIEGNYILNYQLKMWILKKV